MDGLGRVVGDGITSVVRTAYDAIGSGVRALVDTADAVVPYGLLPVVVLVAVLTVAWVVARR